MTNLPTKHQTRRKLLPALIPLLLAVILTLTSCITINPPASSPSTEQPPAPTTTATPSAPVVIPTTTPTPTSTQPPIPSPVPALSPSPTPSPTPKPTLEPQIPDIEAFISTPDWQPSYTIAQLTAAKANLGAFFKEDYYTSRPYVADKYKSHDKDALRKALNDLGQLAGWKYKPSYFDCSEMSALVELYLEVAGFDTVVVLGRDPAVQGAGHAWVVIFLQQPKFEAVPVEATVLTIPKATGNTYGSGVIMNYEDYLKSGWVLRDIYEAWVWRSGEFDWWNSYPLSLEELFGMSPVPLPTPTPTPTPVPPTPTTQHLETPMQGVSILQISYMNYTKYLQAGDVIDGVVQLTGPSREVDNSYTWTFQILGPGGESIKVLTGDFRTTSSLQFHVPVSYVGTYRIRVTHQSISTKTLTIDLTPPGWGYSGP